MFKVECPGCKAPYQVDERRVPQTGLKMRCPKCGTSFQVDAPGAPRQAPTSAESSSVLGAALGFTEDSNPSNAAPPPPRTKAALKGTMIGVAPAGFGGPSAAIPRPGGAPPIPRPAAPRAAVPLPGADSPDLPLPAGDRKPPLPKRRSAEADLPAAIAPKPDLPARRSGGGLHEADLPAAAGQRRGAPPVPRPARPDADLPAVAGGAGAFAPPFPAHGHTDLPAPARAFGEGDMPEMPGADIPLDLADDDLPARAGVGSPASGARHEPEFDLPSPAFGDNSSALGAAAHRDIEFDLPAVGGAGQASRDHGADLPSVGGAGLPSPAHGADLPSVGGAGLPGPAYGADLPSVGGAGLPAPAWGAELPSPSRGADLPSPSYGADLPSVGGNLPAALGVAALPAVGGALPAPAGQTGSSGNNPLGYDPFGSPDPRDPFGGAAPGGDQGFAEDADPFGAPPGGDPFGGAGQPDAFGAPPPPHGDPFGAPAPVEDPFGHAPGGDPFGASPPDADPFGAPPDADPFGAPPDADPFGAPPDADPSGAPPDADPFGAAGYEAGDGDPFGAPPRGAEAFPSSDDDGGAFGSPPEGEDDPFGAAPAPSAEAPARPDRASQAGSSTTYGEVDLGGGDEHEDDAIGTDSIRPPTGDGMEFGAIPQEDEDSDGDRPSGVQSGAASSTHVQMTVGVAPDDEEKKSRRRRRVRAGLAATFLFLLGGGALALVPRIGPFGVHFITDQVKKGDYERALGALYRETQDGLSKDEFVGVNAALKASERASRQFPRYKPLAAYSAYLGYTAIVRFGPQPGVRATAKVVLDELAAAEEMPMLLLARSAQAAAEGNLARARDGLSAEAARDPKNVAVATLLGEVELKARDVGAAITTWEAAYGIERTARTAFGLARAAAQKGDDKRAEALAREALEHNPEHLGARIVLADILWRSKEDEEAPSKLLGEVVAAGDKASSGDRVLAHTLAGEIHLTRGRVGNAEQSFSEALKVNPKAGRALAGFGDALYRAGRFAEALARFEAGVQADADSVRARVGVGKTQIALELFDEANKLLTKLAAEHPKDMNVAYWFGRAQEALGDKDAATKAYNAAIENGGDAPESVHAYVALAKLQSQLGLLEEAAETLARAQEKLPESPAIHKAMGDVAITQGRYEEALAEFQAAVKLDKADIDAQFRVGTAQRRLRRFDEALEIFDAVSKIDRDFPLLALERGLLYEESGRGEEALKEYEAALAKAPDDPDLMLRVGCGKVSAGYGKQAEEILQKVLVKRPKSAETHHCLGRALLLKGNHQDAFRTLRRAVELAPRRAEYHMYVGWAANEMGRLRDAEDSLRRALELDQGLADAYWQRGVLRQKQGAVNDALSDLNRALTLRPARHEAHAALGDVYADLGNEPLAMAEYDKAIAADGEQALWRFRYGKLLAQNLRPAEAVVHLKRAVELGAKEEPRPLWLALAHYHLARSLGNSGDAKEHWRAFLKLGDAESPYRPEALAALVRLGEPYQD